MTDVYMIHNSYQQEYSINGREELLISCLFEEKNKANFSFYDWRMEPFNCQLNSRQCSPSGLSLIMKESRL